MAMDEALSEFSLCPFKDTPVVVRHISASPYAYMSGLDLGYSLDNPSVYGSAYSSRAGLSPQVRAVFSWYFSRLQRRSSSVPAFLFEGGGGWGAEGRG